MLKDSKVIIEYDYSAEEDQKHFDKEELEKAKTRLKEGDKIPIYTVSGYEYVIGYVEDLEIGDYTLTVIGRLNNSWPTWTGNPNCPPDKLSEITYMFGIAMEGQKIWLTEFKER